MKYVIVKSQIIRYIKGQLFYYNVALYILVQSEEYSLIWKAKPLTIQIDKGKWQKKIDKKRQKKWQNN